MRYFITFASYGGHLHGDETGSVDRRHNLPGGRLLEADPQRVSDERQSMNQAPYLLDRDSRAIVLRALREVCMHRGWGLLDAHARTNHVHVVVEAEGNTAREKQERFQVKFQPGFEPATDRKRSARHGSTRWLWKDQDVREAIRYVVEEQGEDMAVFVGCEF